MSPEQEHLNDAVLYALKEGCFFPVPEPKPGASVRDLIQWGAMRNLHDAIAAFTNAAAPGPPPEPARRPARPLVEVGSKASAEYPNQAGTEAAAPSDLTRPSTQSPGEASPAGARPLRSDRSR